MIVIVHTVNAGGSVWTAEGTEEETGDAVTFGGDWRAMEGIADLIEATGEEIPAEIEDWQVLSRVPSTVTEES